VKPSGHILIIDDEANLRQTLARILNRAGFEVTTAENGKRGIQLLAQHAFDLVYMDIRMPDMSGLEALKLIHAKFAQLPVVLFTAQPDLHTAVDALRSGATDYLLKPLKPEEIIARTRSILLNLEREQRKKELRAQIQLLQAELKELESAGEAGQAQAGAFEHPSDQRYLKRGKLTLDMHARQVTIDQRVIDLPPTAFDYLVVLARHTPNIVDYQTLAAEAQGYQTDPRESKELTKWHIHHLREALEPDKAKPTLIINVRNSGYRLLVD
jgi:DNA-binding response OmpR family regulator